MSKTVLKFVCPECGSSDINSVEEILTVYPITEITTDGDFDYDSSSSSYDSDGKIYCYECAGCHTEIRKENKELITDNIELVKWIEKNCSQN